MVHCDSFGFFLRFYYFCIPMEYLNGQIDALKDVVVETFGRTLDAPTDFDALSSEIQNKTGETISPSTLNGCMDISSRLPLLVRRRFRPWRDMQVFLVGVISAMFDMFKSAFLKSKTNTEYGGTMCWQVSGFVYC